MVRLLAESSLLVFNLFPGADLTRSTLKARNKKNEGTVIRKEEKETGKR